MFVVYILFYFIHKEQKQSLNLCYYILQPAPKQQKGLQFLWRDLGI